MRKFTLVLSLVLGMLVFLLGSVSFADEYEDFSYTWGTVVSISSNKIVLSEYDYYSEQEQQNTYLIGSDVKINNAQSIANISTGNTVEVEYISDGGNNIAKIITIEVDSE